MKRSKPRGRLAGHSRSRPAVLLMLVGIAILCGVGVAIRRRSRTAPAGGGEGEGRRGTSTIVTLVGHEFSFSGHTFRVLESSRDTDDGSLRFNYSSLRARRWSDLLGSLTLGGTRVKRKRYALCPRSIRVWRWRPFSRRCLASRETGRPSGRSPGTLCSLRCLQTRSRVGWY